jgi:LacI family transcriptional regulator
MSGNLVDVAAKAGVSIATASRALNGKGGVKPETRDRILAIAQELNYAASMAGRGLATSSTQTICYVMSQLYDPIEEDPFYPIIMRGVEAELSNKGYHLLLTVARGEQLKSVANFKPVAEGRVDGIILAGPDIPPRFIVELKHQGIPILLIDNNLPTMPIDTVNNDDQRGGQLATTHLIEHGHATIVALLGPQSWFSSMRRGQGYQLAMQQANLPPYMFHSEMGTNIETGKKLMDQALDAVPNLTAVFAANDAMAVGAMRTLIQRRLRVPEDVAVIGFDDTLYSALSEPPLSTMRVFKQELGKLAAKRMLEMLEDEDSTHRPEVQALLATELVTRRSCGCETDNQW